MRKADEKGEVNEMKKNRIGFIAIVIAVILVGSVLTGCTSESPSKSEKSATENSSSNKPTQDNESRTEDSADEVPIGGKVTIGNSTDCTNIAAWRIRSPYERLSWSGIYEPLFKIADDGSLKENLATSLEPDYDNLTYTLYLRDDVYFSDGSHLDADVVVWNFENFKENSQSSATHFSRIESFEKLDDYTVAIHLDSWTSQLPFSLADVAGLMYSKKAFDDNGYDWCLENPVGTGPFILDKWVKDEYKTLVRNENYWNKDVTVYLDSYEIRVVADQTTAENALNANEIDAFFNGKTMFQHSMLTQGYNEYANTSRYGGYFLVYASGVEDSPLSDVRVRQAISYAIDAQTICDTLGYGIDTFSGQYAALGSSFYVDGINDYAYNVEKAKELLTEAGYPDGFETTIYTANELGVNDYMVVLQGYLKEIGIEAKLDYSDNAEWSGTIMYEIPEGMVLFSHGFDNNIINQAYSNFALSNEGNGMLNRSKIVPEDLKTALDNAIGAPDTETMMDEWKTINKLIFDEYCLAYTISHYQGTRVVCNDRILDMGWLATPSNYQDYTRIAVRK